MEPHKIFEEIKEKGNITTKIELREYCDSKLGQILKYLPTRILNSDGAYIIDCVLRGLHESSQNKAKVIELVLKSLRKEQMPLVYCGDIVSRLSLELSRLPIDDLLKWSNDSVQSILHDTDVNMVWRDILPECLNVICTYNMVKQSGSEMSGVEYKVQCIHTLCQCPWKEKQLVQLTAMFKDIQLSKDSHKQVVNKICSYIVKLSPDILPPLVPQLLSLCKIHHLEVVLSHLSHYFNVYLYDKLERPSQDSESTTMDIDDIVEHSPVELSQCLSTCLYHFSQGMADPELILKHIKQWPKTQILRSPFIIDVALTISVKGSDFKSLCLDVIKSSIELHIQDQLRSKESAWVSSVLRQDIDVNSILKALATESANHRQLTVLGLIELAFSLLGTKSRDSAPLCRRLAHLLLVTLCKAQPETAPHILSRLADLLAGDCSTTQYADCLHILCEAAPVSVERCPQLTLIVEGCPGPNAAQIYEALRPLLAYSERTRDAVVKTCRKRLFFKDSQHRRLAVSGFLSVLKHMRISGSWQRSQAQDEHSYLTQLSVDLHATSQGNPVPSRTRNETVCLEIVSILRRCLVQDASVKQFFYNGIYSCVKEKKALHEPILELLYENLTKYISEDDEEAQDSNTPVLLDKCINYNGVLTEPIGHLLFTIAQFLQNEEDESDDILGSQSDSALLHVRNKLTAVMQTLCRSEWPGIIDTEEPIADLTPESRIKTIKMQQVLQCYEALIAHRVMQWNRLNAEASSVYTMQKEYNQLLDSTRVNSKQNKRDKANETRESTKSQKNKKSQKSPKETQSTDKSPKKTQNTVPSPKKTQNTVPSPKKTQDASEDPDNEDPKRKKVKKGKAPVTLASAAKDKAGPFKPLPCLWDLQLGVRVLELLYSQEVPWSSTEQRNLIRCKRDFHLFAIRSVQSLMNDKLDRRTAGTHVTRAAGLLYTRTICRFSDVYAYDEYVTFACLELFKTCLTTLLSNNYTLKTDKVILGITGSENSASMSLAEILDALHNSLNYLETENREVSLDAVGKKTFTILVQICTMFLEMPVKDSSQLSEALVRLESLSRRSGLPESLPLCVSVCASWSRSACDAPLLDRILRRLADALDVISEEESPATQEAADFPCIDGRTGHSTLVLVCTHLGERYKSTTHLLARAKDLGAALGYATDTTRPRVQRELVELFKAIQVQLCQLTTWVMSVAKLRCSIGSGSDKVLALCVGLYSLLASFVKLLDLSMAQNIHLERLLRLSGRKLSRICDDLVSYVSASQKDRKAVSRDSKLVPRLVKQSEAFNANVMLLKQDDYQKYLSLGTARDFKIKDLHNRMSEMEPAITQETTCDDDDDASTVVLGTGLDSQETDDEDLEECGGKKIRTA